MSTVAKAQDGAFLPVRCLTVCDNFVKVRTEYFSAFALGIKT
ncbi:hypothetical protein BN136_2692 [Cronobacter universalis NCTC 9529]|nr:hypothetical protein BN136_2692 [Cronobacter universalis NCTC 9529]